MEKKREIIIRVRKTMDKKKENHDNEKIKRENGNDRGMREHDSTCS